MKFYDNQKTYTTISAETNVTDMKVVKKVQEKIVKGDTWFVNSLFVIETSIQSWVNIQELVQSNDKQLQIKLLKYKSTDMYAQKVECDDREYSWYVITFSYELDSETLYGGQYFLIDDEVLYVTSLSSDDEKDIEGFTKSIDTIACK